jgi:two-component system nitrogen regulation response regulator NtrX
MAIILIVEDDEETREVISGILLNESYDVFTAVDGAEALRWMHGEQKPDLILLDLSMPGLDGWALLAVKELDDSVRDIPVVVVTGLDAVEVRMKDTGSAVLILHKPFGIDRLLSVVHCCIRSSGSTVGECEGSQISGSKPHSMAG